MRLLIRTLLSKFRKKTPPIPVAEPVEEKPPEPVTRVKCSYCHQYGNLTGRLPEEGEEFIHTFCDEKRIREEEKEAAAQALADAEWREKVDLIKYAVSELTRGTDWIYSPQRDRKSRHRRTRPWLKRC